MTFTNGRTKPCPDCPWRRGRAACSHPDALRHANAADSTFSGEQGFHVIMACHMNPDGTDGACIGYLLSDHASANFAVRMAAIREPETFAALDEPDPDELHEGYPEMLAGLEAVWGPLR